MNTGSTTGPKQDDPSPLIMKLEDNRGSISSTHFKNCVFLRLDPRGSSYTEKEREMHKSSQAKEKRVFCPTRQRTLRFQSSQADVPFTWDLTDLGGSVFYQVEQEVQLDFSP